MTIMTTVTLLTLIVAWDKATTKEAEAATEIAVVSNDLDTKIDLVLSAPYYTMEEFEELKKDTIETIKEDYVGMGFSEDARDEFIELVNNLEYDNSFEYCYNLDQLERDYVNLLVRHDILPQPCAGRNFDEISEIDPELLYGYY